MISSDMKVRSVHESVVSATEAESSNEKFRPEIGQAN